MRRSLFFRGAVSPDVAAAARHTNVTREAETSTLYSTDPPTEYSSPAVSAFEVDDAGSADLSEPEPEEPEGGFDPCPICMDPLVPGCNICALPCSHLFHAGCVRELREFGISQACPLCRAAVPPGPEKLYEEAVRLFLALERIAGPGAGASRSPWLPATEAQASDMRRVVALWTDAASGQGQCVGPGLAEAQFALGYIHDEARGVDRDFAVAVGWYRKAAKLGHASAQFSLGSKYSKGQGVAQDYAEAVKHYRKAAQQGNASAQFSLGSRYVQGQGVAKDLTEAVKWFEKAAEQGDADAQFNLGIMFAHGRGVPKDQGVAVRWFRRADASGHPFAQFNLGFMYERGQGVKSSASEAARFYRKAAVQGHTKAQFSLGVLHDRGRGVAKSASQAVAWYAKAAAAGHAAAQFNLGSKHERGEGVPMDKARALAWFVPEGGSRSCARAHMSVVCPLPRARAQSRSHSNAPCNFRGAVCGACERVF